MTGREKKFVRHFSEDDLNHLLTETDDEKVSKRLIFVKRPYKGATLEDAADDVGMSQSTGSRCKKLWNKGGLGLFVPIFGMVDPRSSLTSSESVCLTCSKRVILGINRRFSTSLTPSSMSSTT